MNKNITLITGATSGLGYSAARQLAGAGWRRVIVTGRSGPRADQTAAELASQTGKPVFAGLALDLNTPSSIHAAVAELVGRGEKIDFLLLNAGMVAGSELVRTSETIEITSAPLIGHHQLTMGLLARGLLAPNARIVIASSEATRGDVPMFSVVDLNSYAARYHNGNTAAAAEALMRGDATVKYNPNHVYANAKLLVNWWVQALARKLPDGMAVYAISPGSAPDTAALRNAGFFMKYFMMPAMKLMPGMSQSVDVAAHRYLQASEFGINVSGEFFASPPGKVTGPLQAMRHDHFHDRASQEAAWQAVAKVSGTDYPSVQMPIRQSADSVAGSPAGHQHVAHIA